LPVYNAKNDSLHNFPFFSYHHPDLRTDFCLIANTNGLNILIPSLRQINFLLLLQGAANKEFIDNMIGGIRKITGIQAVLPIIQSGIKEMPSLMEDIELHKIELSRQQEEKKGKLYKEDEK
jgi:hypothetical protein